MDVGIPRPLKVEHEELHAELVALTKAPRLHAEFEEQVLYPAAIFVGEQIKARLAG